jgi:hypothetical protein
MFFSKRKKNIVVLLTVAILLVGLSSFTLLTTAETVSSSLAFYSVPARLIGASKINDFEDYNWAGYAINASEGSVTQVKGSWTQPAVTCPSSGVELAAFWTGIDGLTSTTVEQTGTIAECANGVASYFAWYEFYPSASVTISTLKIEPGNVISASVKYSATTSKFTVTIKDVTTSKSFSKSSAVSGAQRSSAEWIAEAPSSCSAGDCLYSLPNFATASYGKDTTSVSGTNDAVISGSTKVVSGFGSMVDSLTMVSESTGNPTMAQPSGLSTDGTSFSITWLLSGP